MEPLAVVASTLTSLDNTKKIVSITLDLYKAPQELKAFQISLGKVDNTLKEVQSLSKQRLRAPFLVAVLGRAHLLSEYACEFVRHQLLRIGSKARVKRLAWLRYQRKVQELTLKFNTSRDEIRAGMNYVAM